MHRGGINRRQFIEKFGFNAAIHLHHDSQCGWSKGNAKVSPNSFDFQQGAMAAEARPERRHPPVATRRAIGKSRLQDEKYRRAAEISELAKHGLAPTQIVRCQT